jgi:hypothetical protein
VNLTTHRHLMPRLRMRGGLPPPPNVFLAWCLIKQWIRLRNLVLSQAQGQLHVYLYLCASFTRIFSFIVSSCLSTTGQASSFANISIMCSFKKNYLVSGLEPNVCSLRSSSSSGREVGPVNDMSQPHDYLTLENA